MTRSRSRRLRYLKARLSIFTRPSFLVAAVFLSVVGFVVKEYWTNPDFFKLSQIRESLSSTSSNSQSTLSDEDRAIAADIDNLSVLDYDKQQANIPITPNINDSNKIKKQNEAQLNKILDLAKKNQKAEGVQANTAKSQTTNAPSASEQNPFLKQAENLLKFNFGSGNVDASANNLSPFSANSQTSQSSFGLGINNNNFVNPNQNTNSQSALQKAIDESNQSKQTQEKSTANTATEKNNFGKVPQTSQQAASSNSSTNRRLPQNQTNSDVNTTIFNQPLNTQQQNPYNNFNSFNNPNNPNNFNNNQFPANNFNQPGLNNQPQNPYGNFNNNQVRTNNNQLQNPYGNFNNTQVPRNNNAQPNLPNNNFNNNQFQNNQQQNPYSNFNRSQLPANNSVQNPYNNFNNQTRVNGYSPQTQTRINNAYNRLINRDFPGAATRNNYTAPNNNINRGIQQPNVQQYNSPYNQ